MNGVVKYKHTTVSSVRSETPHVTHAGRQQQSEVERRNGSSFFAILNSAHLSYSKVYCHSSHWKNKRSYLFLLKGKVTSRFSSCPAVNWQPFVALVVCNRAHK
jgi:hypothetical protein